MSIADFNLPGTGEDASVPIPPNEQPSSEHRPLHRLGAVRRLQGVSRRAIARRMKVDLNVVKQQEQETCDISLSALYQWQEMLEVPVAELLVDSSDPLSPPIQHRAQMVRVMKTALSILERSNQLPIRRMAQTLVGQLQELMPELNGISAWHAVGQRRRLTEFGRAADRRLSSDVFMDFSE